MIRSLALILICLVLAACTPNVRTEYVYVEVKVPVAVRSPAPEWLATPYIPEALPEFLPAAPGHVTLDSVGVNNLKTILRTLTTRDEAWRVWSQTDVNAPE